MKLVPRFIRSSFRTKLFVAFLILGGSASVDTTFYIGRLLRRVDVTEARALMFATVVQMAEALDAEAIANLSASGDPRSEPAFNDQRALLVDMRTAIVTALDQTNDDRVAADTLVDLYVLARTDREGWGRLVVTYNEDEAGRDYDMSRFPSMMLGWQQATVEEEVATDEYGTTLSAYAPVRDADGNVIAIVGIDAAGLYFRLVLAKTILVAVAMFIGAILFSLLFAWLVSRFMSRSLGRLAAGMSEVADGNLDATLEPFGSDDEFDRLIGQFNEMISGLRDREAMRRDLGEAAEIQGGLLPAAAPTIPGFSISGGIRYCQQAGGDYFDYIQLARPDEANGSWGIVIGDVTGHGIASALLMCSSRAVLRSAAWRTREDVAALLTYVNEHLVHDSPAASFMTMFYGVLDAARRRFVWSNAGHDPGLLVRATDGETTHLKSTDIPLGIRTGQQFDAGEAFEFEPGDVLVLGTDGVSQARDHTGEFFGFERITDVVRAHATDSAKAIRDAIFDATNDHRGGEQPDDDVTLVVIKCEA